MCKQLMTLLGGEGGIDKERMFSKADGSMQEAAETKDKAHDLISVSKSMIHSHDVANGTFLGNQEAQTLYQKNNNCQHTTYNG